MKTSFVLTPPPPPFLVGKPPILTRRVSSLHADVLPYGICVYHTLLVLIAQVVFLLERGHTNTITDATNHPTHASAIENGIDLTVTGLLGET